MLAAMNGRDDGQSMTAANSSHDGGVRKSSEKPSAPHPGSDLNSMNPSDGVQLISTQKADTRASSSRKTPSKGVDIRGTKRVRRNRKAEGLPPNYCFQCEEEHPWPDEDGTTHHTGPLRKRRRKGRDEPAQQPTAIASQDLGQQSPNHVIEGLKDPPFMEALLTEVREADSNAKWFGKMLTLSNGTRAQGERLMAGGVPAAIAQKHVGPPPVDGYQATERDPSARDSREATLLEADSGAGPLATIVSLYNGTYPSATPEWAPVQYHHPSHPAWPSQPPRGGRSGRHGRGRGRGSHRATSSPETARNAADNASFGPDAYTAAPAADSAAQTGTVSQPESATQATQSGQRQCHSYHSFDPTRVTTAGDHDRDYGDDGGASA